MINETTLLFSRSATRVPGLAKKKDGLASVQALAGGFARGHLCRSMGPIATCLSWSFLRGGTARHTPSGAATSDEDARNRYICKAQREVAGSSFIDQFAHGSSSRRPCITSSTSRDITVDRNLTPDIFVTQNRRLAAHL
jgi:hypothetical protein